MNELYSNILKRGMDLVLILVVLPFLIPLLGVVCLLVRFGLGSPVLFRQRRIGHRDQPFFLVKFRTMSNERDNRGGLLPDEQRMGRLGAFLRKTSLDEVPTFWNVLRGDMTLVGPRPLLPEYLPLYNATQRRRHDVPPGITGWAQVNGRNAISWEEKFAYDVWYVDNRSFWLDVKILARTALSVMRRKDITPKDAQTMPAFTGNSDEK
jgi:lipopolysaccharide/colanic/teichoic acid biosynthesis glycosyltransferase